MDIQYVLLKLKEYLMTHKNIPGPDKNRIIGFVGYLLKMDMAEVQKALDRI